MRRIIFVCFGNTCRSPMAAALARHYLKARGVKEVEVQSAGIRAVEGCPASTEAREAMKRYNLDLEDHRSGSLRKETAASADLILTMESVHSDYVRWAWPETADRVFPLGEYAAGPDWEPTRRAEGEGNGLQPGSRPPSSEVADPFGLGIEAYHRCAEQLSEMVRAAVSRFLEGG